MACRFFPFGSHDENYETWLQFPFGNRYIMKSSWDALKMTVVTDVSFSLIGTLAFASFPEEKERLIRH